MSLRRRTSFSLAPSLLLLALPAGCSSDPTLPGALDEHPVSVAQYLGVTHTVCPSGCDFPSPAACAVGAGVTDGDICLVQGGEYHETVQYQTGALRSNLVLQCEAGKHCLIDGDGIRDYGFNGYANWVVDGFEITGTRVAAVAAYYRVAAACEPYFSFFSASSMPANRPAGSLSS